LGEKAKKKIEKGVAKVNEFQESILKAYRLKSLLVTENSLFRIKKE
jgi:hypothetical protein